MKWAAITTVVAALATWTVVGDQTKVPPPPNPGSVMVPPLPRKQTPIERFRRLLASTTEERNRNLAKATPEAKSLILAKLAEFEKLRPDERELRLRVAQLQESLLPILQAKPADREALLADSVPEDQPLLVERLKAWDQLTAEARQEILDSNRRFSWFARLDPNETQQWDKVVTQSAPAVRLQVVQQLDLWKALPAEDRTRRATGYQQFFELSRDERSQALHVLSPTEQQQMEKALADFRSLTAADRTDCIAGYKKFSGLTPAEREQFLRNVTKWQAMTPAERLTWRRMVVLAHQRPPAPIPRDSSVAEKH